MHQRKSSATGFNSHPKRLAQLRSWRYGCFVLAVCLGCTDPAEEFEEASRADTPEAYTEFLEGNPSGDLAKVARSRLSLLLAWRSALDSGGEALLAFAQEHPAGPLASEALESYRQARIQEALESLASEDEEQLAPHANRLLADRRLGSLPAELVASAIAFLLKYDDLVSAEDVCLLPAASWASGRSLELRPLGAATYTCSATPNDEAGQPMTLSPLGWTSGASGDALVLEAHGVKLALATIPGDGVPIVGLIEITGPTVEASTVEELVLTFDASDSQLLFKTDWFGPLYPVMPAGEGTLIRVRGRVPGLARELVLVGESSEPLVFRVDAVGMLRYLAGCGTLEGASGETFSLPDDRGRVSVNTEAPDASSDPRPEPVRLAQRVLSTDGIGGPVLLRDLEHTPGYREVIAFDFTQERLVEGESYVLVSRGARALDAARDRAASDVLVDVDDVWVSVESLACDDTWQRIWTSSGSSVYLRNSPSDRIISRFTKDKGDAFERVPFPDLWPSGPDQDIGKAMKDERDVIYDEEKQSYYFMGSASMAMGSLVAPVQGLYSGLTQKSGHEFVTWMVAAGVPEERAEAAECETREHLAALKAPGMTFGGIVKIALENMPVLTGILADPRKNYIQPLAEAIDKMAGDKAFGFGRGGSPMVKAFSTLGGIYTLKVPAEHPYPFGLSVFGSGDFGTGMGIFEGTIRVVPDVDGQPIRWIEDGTGFRYGEGHGLRCGVEPVGVVLMDFVGKFEDGFPRRVSRLVREAKYTKGPFTSDSFVLEVSSKRNAAIELLPDGAGLRADPFGGK